MTCKHGNSGRCRMCRQDRLEERYGVPEDHIGDTEEDDQP